MPACTTDTYTTCGFHHRSAVHLLPAASTNLRAAACTTRPACLPPRITIARDATPTCLHTCYLHHYLLSHCLYRREKKPSLRLRKKAAYKHTLLAYLHDYASGGSCTPHTGSPHTAPATAHSLPATTCTTAPAPPPACLPPHHTMPAMTTTCTPAPCHLPHCSSCHHTGLPHCHHHLHLLALLPCHFRHRPLHLFSPPWFCTLPYYHCTFLSATPLWTSTTFTATSFCFLHHLSYLHAPHLLHLFMVSHLPYALWVVPPSVGLWGSGPALRCDYLPSTGSTTATTCLPACYLLPPATYHHRAPPPPCRKPATTTCRRLPARHLPLPLFALPAPATPLGHYLPDHHLFRTTAGTAHAPACAHHHAAFTPAIPPLHTTCLPATASAPTSRPPPPLQQLPSARCHTAPCLLLCHHHHCFTSTAAGTPPPPLHLLTYLGHWDTSGFLPLPAQPTTPAGFLPPHATPATCRFYTLGFTALCLGFTALGSWDLDYCYFHTTTTGFWVFLCLLLRGTLSVPTKRRERREETRFVLFWFYRSLPASVCAVVGHDSRYIPRDRRRRTTYCDRFRLLPFSVPPH